MILIIDKKTPFDIIECTVTGILGFINASINKPVIDMHYFSSQVRKNLLTNNFSAVYVDGERVLGGISFYIDNGVYEDKLDAHESIWWTCSSISPIRRVKVAAALLRESCKWAKELSINNIFLKMEYESESTLKLLKKIGFTDESRVYKFRLGV